MDNSFIRGNSEGVDRISGEESGLVYGEVRPESGKQFCSIDYFDHEGDRVIRHAFLSAEERQKLVDECIKNGIQVKIYDLSTPAVQSE